VSYSGAGESVDSELFYGSKEMVGLGVVHGGATEDFDAPGVGQGGGCGVHGCTAWVSFTIFEQACYQAERVIPHRMLWSFLLACKREAEHDVGSLDRGGELSSLSRCLGRGTK
jgi:hypothetical protein